MFKVKTLESGGNLIVKVDCRPQFFVIYSHIRYIYRKLFLQKYLHIKLWITRVYLILSQITFYQEIQQCTDLIHICDIQMPCPY